MGAPKGSSEGKEKSISGLDKEVQDSTQEDLSPGDAGAVLRNDQAQTEAAAKDGGNLEVVLHEQVNVFVRKTKTIFNTVIEEERDGKVDQIEEEEGKAGEEEDNEDEEDEDADAEQFYAGEQELAEEGEESGDSQEDKEEVDNEEEDEESKKRSLKQKWWDYMTT